MNLKNMFWILAGIILLRVIGIINNVWLLFGIIILIGLWSWLRQIAGMQRLIDWSFSLLTVIAVISTIGWNIYTNYVQPNTPMTRAATNRAQIATDLDAALRLNPAMLKSRLEVANQLQWLQDRIGDDHAVRLATIRQRMKAGKITPEAAWNESRQAFAEEKFFGDKTQKDVSVLLGKNADSELIGSWPWRMTLFGIILLAAAIFIPKKVELPGRKLMGFLGSVLLVTGVALLFFPEVQARIETGQGKNAPAAISRRGSPARSASQQLPANAKLVAIIEPGEIAWQTLTSPDQPPPKRWTVNTMTGYVGREAPWPTGSKICGTRNPIDQSLELYTAGQDVKISSAPKKYQRGD